MTQLILARLVTGHKQPSGRQLERVFGAIFFGIFFGGYLHYTKGVVGAWGGNMNLHDDFCALASYRKPFFATLSDKIGAIMLYDFEAWSQYKICAGCFVLCE